MKKRPLIAGIFSILVVVIGFVTPARAEFIYGLESNSSALTNAPFGLVRFDSATPGTVTTIGNFTGVIPGQTVRTIDFRPANGVLYAISTNGAAAAQLYSVNLATAVLTPIGVGGFTLGTNTDPRVEMDFNPVVDRIRIVTGETGTLGRNNNFRLNPNTGVLVTANDTNLVYAPADANANLTDFILTAAAYSNNTAGAATTTLYGWDWAFDTLVTIGSVGGATSPNTGSMFTINTPLSFITQNSAVGMDISGSSATCYVTHDNPPAGTSMSLFSRNVTTGVQTTLGAYPASRFIVDISVQSAPLAAGVTISGRLLNSEGRGIVNARVKLTNPDGSIRSVFTIKGGRYAFDDVETGATYIVTAQSRNYQFAEPTRIISLTDAIADLDFVGTSIFVSR